MIFFEHKPKGIFDNLFECHFCGVVAAAVIGGGVGIYAANKASKSQSDAADKAAKTSKYATDAATQLQKEQYDQTRADQKPWHDAGVNALGTLTKNLDTWNKPYSGQAPEVYQQATPTPYGVAAPEAYVRDAPAQFTMADFQADPSYQFRMDQGMKALQNSAAAKGGLLGGNTLKGIQDYSQGLASTEYGNAYNRFTQNQDRADQIGQSNFQNQEGVYSQGLNEYNRQQQYAGQVGQQNYGNKLNAYNTARTNYMGDQDTAYNRYATLAGVGQTANNALATAGANYANNAGNLTMANAANQGIAAIAGGNAQAAAYQGWGNALGQAANAYGKYSAQQPPATNYASSYAPQGSGYSNWVGAGYSPGQQSSYDNMGKYGF